MKLLHIETATTVCSVGISENKILLAQNSIDDGFKHAEILNSMVKNIFIETDTTPVQLSAVSVSIGPGSYTGLRIGLSFCKGLAYGLNIPVIAINTLSSMANVAHKKINPTSNQFLVPMIDARRMEVYTSIYDYQLIEAESTTAKIIDEKSFENWIGKDLIFFGNGAEKCNTILNKENHIFYDQNCCEASGQVELASDLFSNKIFNTLAHLEPFYLKEFQTNTKEK
ncbi:MAG: tRNA (adenosine(37)-N6)-threonylcarbamoyltransferase complex dimerization subunit type 1 TsaB [Bacteroidota bacterium]